MKAIVVTGAAGFIGSNLIAALSSGPEECKLIAVDTPEARERSGHLAEFQIHDFIEMNALPRWLENNAGAVRSVIHMGACSDTTQTDRAYMMRNNFEYTRLLWNFCAAHRKRMVYASSAATYGDGSAGYDDTADPALLKPLNLYGESKQHFDLFALEQTATPAGWAGLKFFNVYGPREQHKGRMASMVYHSWRQIIESGEVRLFKSDRPGIPDGGQKRDFIFIKDVVAAVLHFHRAPAAACKGLFNVGTGTARTFSDLANAAFAALERTPRILYVPMPDDLKGRYQYFTQATTNRLRASGFEAPFHSLEDGVRECIRSFGPRDGSL